MQAFTFVVLAMVAGLSAATSQLPADTTDLSAAATSQLPADTTDLSAAAIPAGSRPTGFYYAVQTYDNTPAPANNFLPANAGYINPYALNYPAYPGAHYGYHHSNPYLLNHQFGYNPSFANPYFANPYLFNGLFPTPAPAAQA